MVIIFILLFILLYLIFSNINNFENTNNFTVISNTCVSFMILKQYNIKYNNPFIGSIFINDDDYINLANNFIEYINCEPVLYVPNDTNKKYDKYEQQTNSKYYIHDDIKIPYPVLLLNDIKVHYIHENNNEVLLNKYNKRCNRLKELINNKHKIFITLSFSELVNEHDNYELIIDKFLQKINNDNIIKLFIGPPQFYKKEYEKNYMIIDEWKDFNFTRNKSNIFISNNQNFNTNNLKKLIDMFI